MSEKVEWASPGALGLAGFGLTTVLLNLHNAGLIEMPLITFCYGFFYGGVAQVIAGIIDGKRGDIFGLTAFTSYGLFWIGLALATLLDWLKIVTLTPVEAGYVMLMWGIFTAYLTPGSFKITRFALPTVFVSLTILFFLLSAAFFVIASGGSVLLLRIAGIEGIFCGLSAMYTSAGIVLNTHLGRKVLPL